MSDLSAKFSTLEGQLASQASAIQALVDEVESLLGQTATTLDTININNAVNTRLLLAALSGADPCATCPPPSLIIPPIEDTPYAPDEETCKRGQAFVAFMNSAMTMLDIVSGLGTGTFPSLVLSAYDEVIASSASYAGVPLISFPEAVNLVGRLVNYAILNIGRGDTLASQFGSISGGLLPLFYSSVGADNAKSLYMGYVAEQELPSDELNVFTGAAYDALFTWFFSPESSPDVSEFSGGLCGAGLPGITECVDIVATKLFDDGFFRYFLLAPPASEFPHETAGDFFGFSFEVIDGVPGIETVLVYRPAGGGSRALEGTITVGNVPHTYTHHTSTIDVYTDHDEDETFPFTVRVCPPV